NGSPGGKTSLPVEIVEMIVQEVLRSQTRAFSSIAALSVVSRQLRNITLRAYFSNRMNDIPNSCSWVRHLSTTMLIVEKRTLPLYNMRLESLVLDVNPILLVFPHLPETLVSLRLTSLPRITQLLLMEIARRCVNLSELELSVVQRLNTDCCWACFEELSSCTQHSPVGSDALSYTAGDLAMLLTAASIDVLCRVPSALVNLKRLSLGVFLSSPVVLKEHIDNHSLTREDVSSSRALWTIRSLPPHARRRWPGGMSRVHPFRKSAEWDVTIPEKGAAIGCRPYTPSKCSLCWEAYGLRTRKDELMATMRLAQNLRSLEFIRWSSWFNPIKVAPHRLDRSPEDNRVLVGDQSGLAELGDAQWAAFEIQREERRIKVWRRT
ncbi:hypothetical protein BJV77DRAFT_1025206, partial [Russula vinacea]